MKDNKRRISPSSSSASSSSSTYSSDSASCSIFGRGRYKVWALAAILLLAFWSMFAGTITLKRTAGTLTLTDEDIESVLRDDLDVLEVEDREKVVRHMWDVYSNSRRSNLGLPRFWQEAFEAAYDYLVSDDPGVRNAAILEIAKMFMMSNDIQSPPAASTITKTSSAAHRSQNGGGAIGRDKAKNQEERNKKSSSTKAVQQSDG